MPSYPPQEALQAVAGMLERTGEQLCLFPVDALEQYRLPAPRNLWQALTFESKWLHGATSTTHDGRRDSRPADTESDRAES